MLLLMYKSQGEGQVTIWVEMFGWEEGERDNASNLTGVRRNSLIEIKRWLERFELI